MDSKYLDFLKQLIASPVAVAILSLYFVYQMTCPILNAVLIIPSQLQALIIKMDNCTSLRAGMLHSDIIAQHKGERN